MLINLVGISSAAPTAASQAAPPDLPSKASAAATAAIDDAQLKQAVRDANTTVASLASSIEFSIDSQSGKTVVRVVDTTTQQLIRQIPSPEMLEISHALDRMQGLLLRQRA